MSEGYDPAVQCQRMIDVDDAARVQCPNEATRRVFVRWENPSKPGQQGYAATLYIAAVCDEHDPDPDNSAPINP